VLVFLPLNPHSLFNRAVVLPQDARVSIRLPEGSGLLSCDGQVSTPLEAGAEVQVALGRAAVELVRFDQRRNFFELLRQKLRWGQPLTDGGE
jgi:NAD+ kinase